MPPCRFLFRADASVEIGTGHVMRCLTLARALVRGTERSLSRLTARDIGFVCREAEGNLLAFIRGHDFLAWGIDASTQSEAEDADATLALALNGASARPMVPTVIVDHYRLGAVWESCVRAGLEGGRGIAVIDDLADRLHDCDVLVDQNLVPNFLHRYDALVPPHAIKFLGPGYALLREEFYETRHSLRVRTGHLGRVLVLFGGSDPRSDSLRTLRVLASVLSPDVFVDVVVGSLCKDKEEVQRLSALRPNTACHVQSSNVARLMAVADLLIMASGSSSWERCYLGVPAITIVAASNQALVAACLAETGASLNLGESATVTDDALAAAVAGLARDPGKLRSMSEKALTIVGDDGGKPEGALVRTLLGS